MPIKPCRIGWPDNVEWVDYTDKVLTPMVQVAGRGYAPVKTTAATKDQTGGRRAYHYEPPEEAGYTIECIVDTRLQKSQYNTSTTPRHATPRHATPRHTTPHHSHCRVLDRVLNAVCSCHGGSHAKLALECTRVPCQQWRRYDSRQNFFSLFFCHCTLN